MAMSPTSGTEKGACVTIAPQFLVNIMFPVAIWSGVGRVVGKRSAVPASSKMTEFVLTPSNHRLERGGGAPAALPTR